MFRAFAICVVVVPLGTGCASYATISNAGINTPKVYSGTRLNLAALHGDESAKHRFPAPPPARPLLDLPLSLVLDTALLPLTIPSATYELIFE